MYHMCICMHVYCTYAPFLTPCYSGIQYDMDYLIAFLNCKIHCVLLHYCSMHESCVMLFQKNNWLGGLQFIYSIIVMYFKNTNYAGVHIFKCSD